MYMYVDDGLKSDYTITNVSMMCLRIAKMLMSLRIAKMMSLFKNGLLSLYELAQHFYRELGSIESQHDTKAH